MHVPLICCSKVGTVSCIYSVKGIDEYRQKYPMEYKLTEAIRDGIWSN